MDPLHVRLEDGEARSKLRVLKAATEEGAPRYLAILAVFVEARDRYQVEVSTQQVADALTSRGVGIEHLDAALNQLKEWGNLTWSQDTSRVARLDDFRRRQALWQLTATGHAAHEAVLSILGADDQQGSLQRTLLRDIRDGLAQLAEAVQLGDAEVVYLRLRDLDGALRDLAANARDFHASVALLRREHDVDPERFLAYKHLLIDYLEQFLGHLSTQREPVARLVRAVENLGIERMVSLAAQGDDSADSSTTAMRRTGGDAVGRACRRGSSADRERGQEPTSWRRRPPPRSGSCSTCCGGWWRAVAGRSPGLPSWSTWPAGSDGSTQTLPPPSCSTRPSASAGRCI